MDGYKICEQKDSGVAVVHFPIFEAFPELHCGYSTRRGGVSEGIFHSMNLGFGRGDASENVRENFRRIFAALGIPEGAEVFTKQTHTVNVRIVTEEDRGIGLHRAIPYDDVDGLVTDVPGLALTVFTSDCVPVFLYDPKRKAIGVCHAGWRGTVGGIAEKTAVLMRETYGCDPGDILAAIGPSIGPECFEVGDEVADEFRIAFGESVIYSHGGSKPHVDLWQSNVISLTRAGLTPEHIAVSGLCTMCHPDIFFSHRATSGQRGSNAGFLMMSV